MTAATRDPVVRGRQELRGITIIALASIVWPVVWFADPTRGVLGYLAGSVAVILVSVPLAVVLVDRRRPWPIGKGADTAISRGTLLAFLIAYWVARLVASTFLPAEVRIPADGVVWHYVDLGPNVGRAFVLAWLASSWTLIAVHLVRESEGHVRFESVRSRRWRWPFQRSSDERLHSEG